MTTPRTLTVRLADLTTAAVASATCTLFPIKADYTADLTVVMTKVAKTTDENGVVTFDVVPNTLGSQNTKYRLVATKDDEVVLDVIFQMPDADSELNDLIDAVDIDQTRVPYKDANQTITGDWTFEGAVNLTSTTTISGDVTVSGPATFTGDFDITGKIDLSREWDEGTTKFTLIKTDITDISSSADSLILDFSVNGVRQLQVDKDGNLAARKIGTFADVLDITGGGFIKMRVSGGGLNIVEDFVGLGSVNADTRLYRDAAGVFAQRKGINAQTLRVYKTFTDFSNYERMALQVSGAFIELIMEAEGTGQIRPFRAGSPAGTEVVAGPSDDDRYTFNSSEFRATQLDNGLDLGSISFRWRDVYIGRDIHAAGLPTVDPAVVGRVYNDAGTLKVSAG